MFEVFTVGGGPYLVQALNATAAWTHGGGYIGFLQAVTMLAFIYAMMLTVFDLNWKALLNWFLGTTIIYSALMVPTTSVKVTDTINPSFGPQVVDNVPLGLGFMAGITSEIGNWMTSTAETVFSTPNGQEYTTHGMIYGARLLDQVQSLDIDDPIYGQNLDSYIKKCLLYDIYLGHTNLSDVVNSSNIWTAMQSNSVSLMTPYVTAVSGGGTTSNLVTCKDAYNSLNNAWSTYFNASPSAANGAGKLWRTIYPDLTDSLARAKVMSDLPLVYGALTTNSADAEHILQQAMMQNAFMAARAGSGGSEAASSIDAFAQARADVQTANTYNTAAAQARKWVPILGMMLTIVFYALFPVIFPLFLLPQTGWPTLKGYLVGFFYLASWGPLYVIINMFCVMKFQSSMSAVANGGITLSNSAGVQSLNNEISELAGFMLTMVPFIAAGMAKGALAIGNQAHSFLAPAQHTAEAAASDATTGNYGFGNVNYSNLQANNASTFQQQLAPAITTGSFTATSIGADGSRRRTYAANDVFDAQGAIPNYYASASLNDGIAARSEEQSTVLRNEGTDLRRLQSNTQSWSQSTATARGTNDNRAGGTQGSKSNFTGENQSQYTGADNSNQTGVEHRKSDTGTKQVGAEIYGDAHAQAGLTLFGNGVDATAGVRGSAGINRAWSNSDSQTSSSTSAANAGWKNLSDRGFRNDDGTFYRVSHDTYSSWNQEQRNSYNRALSNEIAHVESASRSFRESADKIRSGGVNINQNVTPDLGNWFRNDRSLDHFSGGGASLLEKPRYMMSEAERQAFDSSMSRFTTAEAASTAKRFSDDQAYLDQRYATLTRDLRPGAEFPKGGRALAPDHFPVGATGFVALPGAVGTVDEFDGRTYARSLGIGIKSSGVELGSLDGRMKQAMFAVATVAKDHGLPGVVVTSGNDSGHMDGSRHYDDQALDFRGNNISAAQGRAWAAEVQRQLGAGYYANFETFDDSAMNHLHVQTRGRR